MYTIKLCQKKVVGNVALMSLKLKFFTQIIVFLVKKPTVVCVKISEKKNIFSSLRSRYHRQANRKKLILSLKTLFCHEWYNHWYCRYITFRVIYIFFKLDEIMLLKYGNQTYIVFDYRTLPSFTKIIQRFISMQITQKRDLMGGMGYKVFDALFFKKSALSG